MKVPVAWLREFADPPADAAEIGERLAACGFEVAGLSAGVLDFEITANRPDCLSVYGLAREAATAFDVPLKRRFEHPDTPDSSDHQVPVSIGNKACGRYALALADVSIGPSPGWLADRLTSAGVRPINNVVDVTNYVMLEMGQPMHAFDAAKLSGAQIHVRLARPNEKLTTLDGQTRALDARMLVIADRDRAVAIAGVMGGAASEVSTGTARIAIESAWFEPASVRATSKRLGLKTEASARFERGADVESPVHALSRALELLAEIGAGRAVGAVQDVYPRPFVRRRVRLRPSAVARLLGASIANADVERILSHLGFIATTLADGWDVTVPGFRVDVAREADLIEEVGRHWGFDRIPATFPELRAMPPAHDPAVGRNRRIRRVLCGAGVQEAVTFTFIEHAAAVPFSAGDSGLVAIANPLSEKFAVLRPSLLPGLLDSLIYSRRRETSDVRVFEVGSTFGPGGERQTVGWMLTGAIGDHWSGGRATVDFFDAKGLAELVATTVGATLTANALDAATPASGEEFPWFVRGRAARLFAHSAAGMKPIGAIGQIRPELALARGLGHAEAVYGGEIDLGALDAAGSPAIRAIVSLPRHPSVIRDLSIVIDERLPAASVRGTIRANAPSTLVAVREFDRYQGKGVPSGHVSLSVRLTFRDPDRTLTDGEVQQAVDAIIAVLTREHRAALRGTTAPE